MDILDSAILEAGASAYVIYATSEEPAMRYLSGFSASDPFLYIKRPGLPGRIIVSSMEYERAVKESKAAVITRSEAGYMRYLEEEGDPWKALARLVREQAGESILVPPGFPYALAKELLPDVTIAVDRGAVDRMRSVKTGDEIAAIERAQRTGEAALAAGLEMIRRAKRGPDDVLIDPETGGTLTSGKVRGEIDKVLVEKGCRPTGTIVSCGRDTAIPHSVGHGPLYAGEPIIIDIFPQEISSGYFADMTRTVVHGEPDPQITEMYEIVAEAKRLAARLIRPGVTGEEVHNAVVDFFGERGYGTGMEGFTHNLGHGVGLAIHEEPSLGPRGRELVAGNVVTVEPGLYYLRIGGVRLEDLGVVTADGFDTITRFEEVLCL
ncbi:MAG: M24 family metallopeptidase [Methanoculleaceae archaeon]